MKDFAQPRAGRVHLVGAGPGDPELLTVKALRLIERAQILVHDRLVSPEILALAPASAERHDVGKAPQCHKATQEQINALLVSLARQGDDVVRLKGGDPFIFGRGSEEAMALRAAGISVEVTPGVTAAQGCAASCCTPLTHRGLASSVRLVTGHRRRDEELDLDWRGLADPDQTLVVYMGVAAMESIAAQLVQAGMSASTPVLVVANGTTPRETRALARLDGAAAAARAMSGPTLFIIGAVAGLYAGPDCDRAARAMVAEFALAGDDG